ncbi:putative glycosyltransferase [Talaromyces proteolyticus]|uniref:Glycosyltransferase n=1 Tax=Talaromyces proteolyticus TaxID=1131652 RepID=A0AAD4KKF4_9EURO|nr:putative glycosyltransferase [Talaromyces proteolyticus]KAH8690244.1 putative glycosyltransferase [Talaromyces proteolyticus]
MHIAFLSNPASGEVNVQLAMAQQLVAQDHFVTFLSAESCRKKVDQLRKAQQKSKQDLVRFISLGAGRTLDDFTPFIQERMPFMRRVPGDPVSLETCIEAALGAAEEHAETAIRVRDHLNALDPDMICVDILTPPLVTGVRLTKRQFILTIPCSPGLTALPGMFEPHMVAAKRDGSWGTLFENMYLRFRGSLHSRTHRDCIAKREMLSRRFGLQSYGVSRDTSLVPPYWEDENCMAGIHFNTPGLSDCPRQSSKIVFVGAGVSVETPQTAFSEFDWMEEAILQGEDVVYINMGSMFIWQRHEFWNCIAGFETVYKKKDGHIRFLFKINFPVDSRHGLFSTDELPSYVRLTNWIEDQSAIYSHPALKAFIHHGGGNSFNEAVYYGIPQLVLSQWLDTHEYANYAHELGLGLRSDRPPHIDAQDIAAKILTLLGPLWPTFKSRCQIWAVRSHIAGGASSAAKIVLSHAELTERQDSGLSLPPSPMSTEWAI